MFANARRKDLAIDAWFAVSEPLRDLVQPWFGRMLDCGSDVGGLIHDRRPTACADGAAFAYVDAHAAHAAIGFFFGAALEDPAGLLEGAGKRMRHVKLRPGRLPDADALAGLIAAAYADIRRRLSDSGR